MEFSVLPVEFVIYRLDPHNAIPDSVVAADMFHIFKSNEELSILVPQGIAVCSDDVELGWSGIKIAGPLDFDAVGIIAEFSGILADAGISLLAVGTFDTDYLFVKSESLTLCIEKLRAAGHTLVSL
jgi:hypothetical protein